MKKDTRPDANRLTLPDANCHTLPDGSCIGVNCMHDPGFEFAQFEEDHLGVVPDQSAFQEVVGVSTPETSADCNPHALDMITDRDPGDEA